MAYCFSLASAKEAISDEAAPPKTASPTVASVDYCADQYVLGLAGQSQILAVSHEAQSSYAYFNQRAQNHRTIRGSAEEILKLQPDVTIRSWRGSQATDTLFKKAGINSVIVPYASTPEGVFESTLKIAEALGQNSTLNDYVNQQKIRYSALQNASRSTLKALYVTSSGYTGGSGTFVDKVLKLSGFESAAEVYGIVGWSSLPLEKMTRSKPDVIIASFFDLGTIRSQWSFGKSDYLAHLIENTPTIMVPSKYLSCNGMFFVEAAYYIRAQAVGKNLIGSPRKSQTIPQDKP
jgi:iron complex transport system substrate-binding protein